MIKPIIITLNNTDYLDKAFRTLPSNAFIHKGRCGIGGTTLEILAKRCSIIIVPTKGIITSKCNKHSELFGVDGDVSVEAIEAYLQSPTKYKKIMSTPDSFGKIITAAINTGKSTQLYQDYFLLMDECHTAITEAFRKNILNPFKYLWNFKRKTFISATPFKFSDKRFEQFQPIYIRFHQTYLGKVIVRPTGNVDACVDYYISNRDAFTGKLFIFYNSVTEMTECIKRNRLTADQAHIYCAANEDNFDKLPDNLLVFQREPTDNKYADFNFFTCKYFEGIDINEENATVLLVTDIHKAHTKVGITNKGVQAIGRLRKPTQQIIHITNNRHIQGMKTIDQFRKEYEIHIQPIESYNSYVARCNTFGVKPLESYAKPIECFADIDEETGIATFNTTRLDQVLNGLVCNEQFNNLDTINEAWEQALYEVEMKPYGAAASKQRKSKADKLKEDIQLIEELLQHQGDYVMGHVAKELARIQKSNPLAYEAYNGLSKTKLAELKYKQKAVRTALIEKHNADAEVLLLAHLDHNLDVGQRCSIEGLVNILQFAYTLLKIRNPKTGVVKKANATDLNEPGRYKLHGCKVEQGGKLVNGYIIEHCYFNLLKAA
ncbi:MAG: hypothetical protein JWQ34_3152 [Mucilaginibacter sp.]|uniref:DEAD/DEAH box helicase family protein n=1 Tax=Mucilaginibacter sp. TaxID=1882438 RepID=UPI002626FD70|nr:DEAD/DEAH box helicase family protein [Mucilaginibacter sp.]MDB5004927.1 hypothetical protein [Mucilaginibacter sp.]